MKKNKKLIIISFLVIFAIIPIPVPNQAKTKITNSIEQIIGREISLGSIKYNILRNIIYLDDFKIYEKDEETTFVSFDSFDMNIELLPLILGKLKLTDITLKNPNISLEYEKDIANYVDILSNISKYNNKNESVDITVEDKKPFIKSFEIKKINVEHITFKYKDKVVEGQNIFTVVVPQISYSDAKITLIAKAIFSETGSIKVNFEYSPESGNFNSEVRLDKLELDDKLYFIRSVDKIKELKGTLNSDIRITGNLKEKEFVGNGGLDISDFMVVSEEHGELVGVKKLEIKINNIEPLKNVYLFDNIYIDNGDYYLDNVSTYINSFSNKEEIEKKIKKDIKKAKSQKIIKNDFLKLNIPKITIKDVKLYSGKNDFFLSLEGKNIGNKKGDSTINLHTKINGNESTTLNLELKKQRDISNKNDLKFISGNIDLNKLSLSILNPFFEESGSQLGGYLNLNSKINTSNGNIITENYLEVIDLVIDEKKSNFKTEMIRSKNKLILLDNDFKLSGTIDVGKLTFNSVGLNTKLPLAHVDIIKITKEDIELGNTEFKGPEVSLEMTKDKKKSPSTVDEKTPSDYIFLFLKKIFYPPSVAAKVKIKAEKIVIPISLEIGKLKVDSGTFKYNYPNLDFVVSKLSINMDGFTTSPNENFTLNYSARFNKTGELKGSNKLSLSKNWDFRTTSLNIDAKFHMRDINLLSFKKILDDIIPNELISGILFYDGVINLKSSVFKGENKILIKNFKLGRSTKVFSVIPVKTATELLKTGDGDLIFDIPISGDFDNPKFNLYGVFVDEIMNILIRVTKSPLTILNSVLHFKHGKIKRINYEYLSIKPKDDEALEKVVSLLKEDDKLKVKIILSTNTVAESKVYKKKHSSVNKSDITNIEMKRKKYIENYFLKNGVLKDSYTEISLFDSEDAIGIIEFYSPIEEE